MTKLRPRKPPRSQMKPQKPSKPEPTKDSFSIERYQSGYVVMKNGQRVTEPNMWPIAMKALERLLRIENGLL